VEVSKQILPSIRLLEAAYANGCRSFRSLKKEAKWWWDILIIVDI